MEQPEVEKLVGELELGVDRLRSLYEQYFMGIEKLEPAVPRKDVDRRIHVLRKEQIRNTALRFRFQMILQRYNTYQTHWQRICREIENGTYKRHVMRANRRFDNDRPRSSAPPPRRSSIPPRPEGASTAATTATGVAGLPLPLPPPSPLGFPQPGSSLPADLAAELAELEREFGPVVPTVPLRPVAPAHTGPARAASPAAAAPPKAPPPRPSPPAASPPVAGRPGPPPQPTGPRVASPPLLVGAGAGAGRPLPPPNPTRVPAPAVATPPVARPPAAPVVAPAASPRPPARSAADLSDQRVRTLYQEYIDAKRRQKESTAAITYDAVARSLRESSAKLREKHGKSIDFEVTIKDGKAILKPVLK